MIFGGPIEQHIGQSFGDPPIPLIYILYLDKNLLYVWIHHHIVEEYTEVQFCNITMKKFQGEKRALGSPGTQLGRPRVNT